MELMQALHVFAANIKFSLKHSYDRAIKHQKSQYGTGVQTLQILLTHCQSQLECYMSGETGNTRLYTRNHPLILCLGY